MNIILLGLPGSGKGTQASLLSKKLNLYYLQTGEIARDLAEKDAKVKNIVEAGRLIPEEEMTKYVLDDLGKNVPLGENILFEGYPRFATQYENLKRYLKEKGQEIDAVILLDISVKEAIKRLSERRICTKCSRVYNIKTNPPKIEGVCDCGGKLVQRGDDKPKAITTRFDAYRENTKGVIEAAKKDGKLIVINGEADIFEIHQKILKKLKG